jgi:hypothetical protein
LGEWLDRSSAGLDVLRDTGKSRDKVPVSCGERQFGDGRALERLPFGEARAQFAFQDGQAGSGADRRPQRWRGASPVPLIRLVFQLFSGTVPANVSTSRTVRPIRPPAN